MNPTAVASCPIIVFITGARINGITMITFNTIGKPKIIGSLIPKIPAGSAILPNVFRRLDFAINVIINTRPNVDPPPPKLQKKSENADVNTLVIGKPAFANS